VGTKKTDIPLGKMNKILEYTHICICRDGTPNDAREPSWVVIRLEDGIWFIRRPRRADTILALIFGNDNILTIRIKDYQKENAQ
jgi:hypothetical protein